MSQTTPQDDQSLNIPSFLKNPTRTVHAEPREDEVDAVMESVHRAAAQPRSAKPREKAEPREKSTSQSTPRKRRRKQVRKQGSGATATRKSQARPASTRPAKPKPETVGTPSKRKIDNLPEFDPIEPAAEAQRKAIDAAPEFVETTTEPNQAFAEASAASEFIDDAAPSQEAELTDDNEQPKPVESRELDTMAEEPEATSPESEAIANQPDADSIAEESSAGAVATPLAKGDQTDSDADSLAKDAQTDVDATPSAEDAQTDVDATPLVEDGPDDAIEAPAPASTEAPTTDVASVLADAVLSFDAPVAVADEDVMLLPENPSHASSNSQTPSTSESSSPVTADDAAPATSATPDADLTPSEQPAPQEPPADVPTPDLEEDLHTLAEVERRLFAHRYASAEIETFGECIDPPKVTADRAEVLAVLVEEDHELLSKPEVDGALKRLTARANDLEPLVAKQVEVLVRDRKRIVGVPASLQAKLVRLQAESYEAWLAAKTNDDWRSFAPYLDRLVSLQRKIAYGMNPDADPYDTMLDMYEKGTNRAFYNNFFARVKQCVVPLLSSISMSGRNLSRSCVEGRFDEARQWELAQDLARLEGIDESAHYLTSTEHPFSQSMTSNYVVTANHVDPNDLMSSVYSMLHEVGHNLYEQGVNPEFNRTSLAGGTSMGMHEAQSRFFENYIGRDRAFVPVLLALIKYRFPGQLGRVTPNQLYRAINRVAPSPTRMDADELTYPLHIIVRYEIEQLLIAGKATAREVPMLWADRYSRYIGANVRNDSQGALQDVHWAQGCFGYFPTYALGNAYAAQLRAKMIEEGLDWDTALSSGDLSPIRAWLHERVWQYGRSKDPADIIKDATGEPFNPRHYANYLTHKYVDLYGLR